MFSPPNEQCQTKKYHLCVNCWDTVINDIWYKHTYNSDMVAKIKEAAESEPTATLQNKEDFNKWLDELPTQKLDNFIPSTEHQVRNRPGIKRSKTSEGK